MASRTIVEHTSDAIWVRPPRSPLSFDLFPVKLVTL